MEIKTKFDIGDDVYFIDSDGKPAKGDIQLIDIFVSRDYKSDKVEININYQIAKKGEWIGSRISEDRVFRTKDDIAEYAMQLTSAL